MRHTGMRAALLILWLLGGCPRSAIHDAADGGSTHTGAGSGAGAAANPGTGDGAAGSGGTPCVQTQACIQGAHWDPTACRCAIAGGGNAGSNATSDAGGATHDAGAAHCVQNVLCIKGSQWSPTLCRCLPTGASDAGSLPAGDGGGQACQQASQCQGPLPHFCASCAKLSGDATTGNPCAHWSCKQGSCQITVCD